MTATHETLARPASLGNAAAGRAGRAAGRRPGQVANCGLAVGADLLSVRCQLSTQVPALRQVI
jgi:hypothetical protein